MAEWPDRPMLTLGWRARSARFRQARQLTQEDLAHASHITVTALVRIEGARANPTWSTVRKIAAGLNVRVSEIADLADQLDRDAD